MRSGILIVLAAASAGWAVDLAPMVIETIEPAKLKEYQFDGCSRLGQLEQTEK